jgi:hypothetical protein
MHTQRVHLAGDWLLVLIYFEQTVLGAPYELGWLHFYPSFVEFLIIR